MSPQGRILIVDDTLASLKLLSDTLKAEAYEVYATDNGELALGAARSRRPELILCDLRMPGMDGLEVCRRLKAEPATRDIPLMFISAANQADEKVEGFAAGAVDFITKPFQRDELLARVRTHLELARFRGELALQVEQRTAELAGALLELEALNQGLEDRVLERTVELERAHLKLRGTAQHLAQAERMAALMTMARGLTRELCEPVDAGLGLARGLAGALAAGAPDPAALRRDADALLAQLLRAGRLIGDFRQLSAAPHGEARSRFALPALVGEVLAGQLRLFKASRHQVTLNIAPDLELDSYPRALGQVLGNLLSNALLHAYAPGSDGAIAISAATLDGGELELVVADHGRGIGADHLPHVFEPFFTTRGGEGRRGMGLALAYALVKDVLGGAIDAASPAEGGARFRLRLPATAPH
jgi:C4-dicarboxylate-specific signal transduction histidine kinase